MLFIFINSVFIPGERERESCLDGNDVTHIWSETSCTKTNQNRRTKI